MERANGVLQDRLIKLMRLAGIASWEAGNAFLPAFLVDYNGRFARPAREPEDAHAPACPPERLRDILCLKETRKLSRQLTCQYHQQWLRILPPKGWERRLIGAAVEIRAHLNSALAICHNSQVLAHELLVARPQAPVVDAKVCSGPPGACQAFSPASLAPAVFSSSGSRAPQLGLLGREDVMSRHHCLTRKAVNPSVAIPTQSHEQTGRPDLG